MIRALIAQLAAIFLMGSVFVGALFYTVPRAEAGERVCGSASYYGTESGNKTATGEHFDGTSMTAAMPSRKHLGERWKVTYKGKSVVVRINDLGPNARLHRVIDLSRAAAHKIGLTAAGVGPVCMVRVG
jgi:rare lipoprotein A